MVAVLLLVSRAMLISSSSKRARPSTGADAGRFAPREPFPPLCWTWTLPAGQRVVLPSDIFSKRRAPPRAVLVTSGPSAPSDRRYRAPPAQVGFGQDRGDACAMCSSQALCRHPMAWPIFMDGPRGLAGREQPVLAPTLAVVAAH